VGFEPTTFRMTGGCQTTRLMRSYTDIYTNSERVGDGESHDAGAEIMAANHSEQCCEPHQTIAYELQPQSEPPDNIHTTLSP